MTSSLSRAAPSRPDVPAPQPASGAARLSDLAVREPDDGILAGLGLDALPDGALVADGQGVVLGLNEVGGRLLGREPESAVGLLLHDVLPLHDPELGDWWACSRPFTGLATRTRQPERLLLVDDGTCPSDAGRPLLVTARYVRRQPAGPVTRLVVCFRHAASRERAERDASNLVATVAHELRSPLTSVKGFTSTLLAKWERFNDAQRRLMLQTVNADADRVTRLITELLDVCRLDTGRLELRPQVVDVAAVVDRVVAGRVAAGDDPERFVVVRGPEPPEMWLDPDKLLQVIANLVENAVRHGAGRVHVTVQATPSADGLEPGAELLVDDEGPGVPEEARSRVFGRFWRAAGGGGSGLGLYVVCGLVQAHGGSVVVTDAPSGGARFQVLLPAGAPPYA